MAIAPFANKPLRVVAGRIFQFWPIHGKIRRIGTTAMNKRTYMNKRTCSLTFVVAASFLLSTPATAGVLYDNGLVNANIGAIDASVIYYGGVVSDSFILTGTSTLTGVNLGIWIASGDIPDYLYWSISDSPVLTATGGTKVSLTDVTKLCNGCVSARNAPADTYFASFSLPDVVEGPGNYFLTLHGSYYLFWDVSNGPSVAWIDGSNAQSQYGDGMTHSNSFQILGDGPAPSATPEPASTALFLSGLALVAGLARRKTRA
jgi:hypothetical protein